MSTKIYNGYYSELKLEPLLEKLKSVTIDFKKLKDEEYSRTLVEEAIEEIDKKSLEGVEFSQRDILSEIYKKHRESIAESKKTNLRLMELIDFSASCCLFPCGRKTLILFYSDNNKVLNLWESLDYIHDYHYQDQCDKPDEISTREWTLREKNWNKVLGGDGWGIPSENGYTFTLSSIDLPYLYKLMPTLSNYIDNNNRANTFLYNKFFEEKLEERKKVEDITNKIGTVCFNIRNEWFVWKETDSYKTNLESIKKNLIEIDFSKTD